jgi:hypothetical protein
MSDFFEGILKLVKALVPPNTNDLGPQQRWRWMVFATLTVLIISQVVQTAASYGYIPGIAGFAPAALASDVHQLTSRVDLSTQVLLERDMKDKQKEICTTKDQAFKRELVNDIDNLQREYRQITGYFYKLRGCNEL